LTGVWKCEYSGQDMHKVPKTPNIFHAPDVQTRGDRQVFIQLRQIQVTREQRVEVENFLASFLPRLKSQPGVAAIYHYARPEKGDESTLIILERSGILERIQNWGIDQGSDCFRTEARTQEYARSLSTDLPEHSPLETRQGFPGLLVLCGVASYATHRQP
jgi:hypothetical protein